jgi:hypothetical protein
MLSDAFRKSLSGGNVRKEWVPEIRRLTATHKRFKRQIDQWIDLEIERSKLGVQIAEPKATRRTQTRCFQSRFSSSW